MSARAIEAVSRVRYPVPFSAAWYPPAVLAGVVEGRLTMHITLLSRVIVFAAAYLILCGCQMAAKEGVPDRYWSTGIEQWVSPQVLSKDARDANYVLLGEIHDNPIHHDAQGELILRLAGEGFVVGFEQLHLARTNQPCLRCNFHGLLKPNILHLLHCLQDYIQYNLS